MMSFALFEVLARGVAREHEIINFFKSIESTDVIIIEVNNKKMSFKRTDIYLLIQNFIDDSEKKIEGLKKEMIESGYIKTDDYVEKNL